MNLSRRILPLAVATVAFAGAGDAGAFFVPSGADDYLGSTPGGQHLYFSTSAALVPEDVDRTSDLYVQHDGKAELVTPGDASSTAHRVPDVSVDGSVVFFDAPERLTADDQDDFDDVYAKGPFGLRRITTGTNDSSDEFAGASDDGSKAWLATSKQLLPGDTDTAVDVYEVQVATGTRTLVSPGTQNIPAWFTGASPDGSHVYFSTKEKLNGTDGDAASDIWYRSGNAVVKASSGDGAHDAYATRVIGAGHLFFSTAEALTAGDTDQAYDLYEAGPGGLKLRTPSPNPAADATAPELNAVSPDGTRVIFGTFERLAPGDTDAARDLYQNHNGANTLLSGNGTSSVIFRDASANALTALFTTTDKLSGSDTDAVADLYRTSISGFVTQVHPSSGSFAPGDTMINDAGSIVAFETAEPVEVADADTGDDVYVKLGGTLYRASTPQAGAPAGPDAPAALRAINGTTVYFETSQALVAEDTNEVQDVYSFGLAGLALATDDTSAPDTAISGLPATAVPGESVAAAIATTETGAGTECQIDGGSWTSCDLQQSFGPLTAGTHTIRARATDVDGNTDASPAEAAVVVAEPAAPAGSQVEGTGSAAGTSGAATGDSLAPKVAGVRAVRRAVKATVRFSLDEAAAVRLVVQRKVGKRWQRVQSRSVAGRAGVNTVRLRLKATAPGLRVRLVARDAAGNRATPGAARLRAR